MKYRLKKFGRIQRSFTKGKKIRQNPGQYNICVEPNPCGGNLTKQRLITLFNNIRKVVLRTIGKKAC
jgi:hypothetical protein